MLRGIVSVPVGAMLSQDHTMRFITFWLSSWAFNNKVSDEIVLDQSAALFGACVQTFTHLRNTNAYISACMDSLLNDTPAPAIFLRIDRYHFICTIHRIKQFKKMDRLKVSFEDQFHEIVAIDCDSSQQNEKTTINDIESRITLNGDEYNLFAAVQYDPTMKHFIPHIKRINNNWETYDDLHRNKSVTDTNAEMFVFMLFYKKKKKWYVFGCTSCLFV